MAACFRLRAEMRIRVGFVTLLALPITMNGEKPFDFGSTPGKLPKQVVPLEYSIRIVPNVQARTFTGTAVIKIKVAEPVRQLVMNALELEVKGAAVDAQFLCQSAIKIAKKQE